MIAYAFATRAKPRIQNNLRRRLLHPISNYSTFPLQNENTRPHAKRKQVHASTFNRPGETIYRPADTTWRLHNPALAIDQSQESTFRKANRTLRDTIVSRCKLYGRWTSGASTSTTPDLMPSIVQKPASNTYHIQTLRSVFSIDSMAVE
jgi:hypothetical protein